MSDPIVDRAALTNELERARADFHRLLAMATDDDWGKPTSGTRWTNEQLLFHMVFGYMVVQRLLVLVRAFGHLPQSFSRRFARVLDWATRPFHFVNYLGSCLAARVYNRTRMEAKMDHVMDVRLCGFGSIEVEGRAYEHDIVIDRGVVRKRSKKPSKPYRDKFGHTPLSADEELPWGGPRLIIGTGGPRLVADHARGGGGGCAPKH
jgi:hypothetical protein